MKVRKRSSQGPVALTAAVAVAHAAATAALANEAAAIDVCQPPGRGMTYAMQQQDPYWDNHAAIQNSISQSRNAEVLRNVTLLASLNRPQENSQPRGD